MQHGGNHQDSSTQRQQTDHNLDAVEITSDDSRDGSSIVLDNSEDDYSDEEKSCDTSLTTTNIKIHQKSSSDKLTT